MKAGASRKTVHNTFTTPAPAQAAPGPLAGCYPPKQMRGCHTQWDGNNPSHCTTESLIPPQELLDFRQFVLLGDIHPFGADRTGELAIMDIGIHAGEVDVSL